MGIHKKVKKAGSQRWGNRTKGGSDQGKEGGGREGGKGGGSGGVSSKEEEEEEGGGGEQGEMVAVNANQGDTTHFLQHESMNNVCPVDEKHRLKLSH